MATDCQGVRCRRYKRAPRLSVLSAWWGRAKTAQLGFGYGCKEAALVRIFLSIPPRHTRRQERREASRRGGGAKAGGAVAQAVGERRSL